MHTYCFTTLDGIHIPMSEDTIEAWVSALVRAISLSLVNSTAENVYSMAAPQRCWFPQKTLLN